MRLLLVVLAACSIAQTPIAESESASTKTSRAEVPVADLARHKAEMLTSIWENGTTVMQYGYCEDIDDGRGYTSGRAGFCSGTGDTLLVAKCVQKKAPNAKVAKYIPALQKLEDTFESTGEDQASTKSLDAIGSFCADWAADASGEIASAFASCQDEIVEQEYFQPAKAIMAKNHLKTALTMAAIYDCAINQGLEGDNQAPGVQQIADTATKLTGTSDESKWLQAFLATRLKLLASNETWATSVDRVANYEQMRRDGNFDLTKPIVTNAKAAKLFTTKNLQDCEYAVCTIAANGAVGGAADCTDADGGEE